MRIMKIFSIVVLGLIIFYKKSPADNEKQLGINSRPTRTAPHLDGMEAFEICDEFSDGTGWRGPNHNGPQAGDYQINSGILKIIHNPMPFFYSSTEVEKDYDFDLTKTTWFHFRFRWKENLIGADMYTEFFVDDKPSSDLESMESNIG